MPYSDEGLLGCVLQLPPQRLERGELGMGSDAGGVWHVGSNWAISGKFVKASLYSLENGFPNFPLILYQDGLASLVSPPLGVPQGAMCTASPVTQNIRPELWRLPLCHFSSVSPPLLQGPLTS